MIMKISWYAAIPPSLRIGRERKNRVKKKGLRTAVPCMPSTVSVTSGCHDLAIMGLISDAIELTMGDVRCTLSRSMILERNNSTFHQVVKRDEDVTSTFVFCNLVESWHAGTQASSCCCKRCLGWRMALHQTNQHFREFPLSCWSVCSSRSVLQYISTVFMCCYCSSVNLIRLSV